MSACSYLVLLSLQFSSVIHCLIQMDNMMETAVFRLCCKHR